jgi:PleD family two-component response regulator
MIIAALDDLMFISRVRATASAVGATVRIVSTVNDGLDAVRQLRPTRVLLDLNSRKFDPLALVTAIKGDPTVSATKIIAFVSHVQADLIGSARAAGADEVIARSAFVSRLSALLGD